MEMTTLPNHNPLKCSLANLLIQFFVSSTKARHLRHVPGLLNDLWPHRDLWALHVPRLSQRLDVRPGPNATRRLTEAFGERERLGEISSPGEPQTNVNIFSFCQENLGKMLHKMM